MKRITVSIPENFYKAFIDFIKSIPGAKIREEKIYSIPAWHKEEALKRLRSSKREDFIPWAEAKKHLKS